MNTLSFALDVYLTSRIPYYRRYLSRPCEGIGSVHTFRRSALSRPSSAQFRDTRSSTRTKRSLYRR